MLRKSLWFGFILLCGFGLVYYAIRRARVDQPESPGRNPPFTNITQTPTNVPTNIPTSRPTVLPDIQLTSYMDISYLINGETVLLKNGISEAEVTPGSSSKIVTRYFGNGASGDLNGDQRDDVAFLLTQNTGGSGTFFYIVAALKTDYGYTGTNAILLGDRIAPQSTSIENGEIVVNYADRKPDEPFTTPPTVGVLKRFAVFNNELVEMAPWG